MKTWQKLKNNPDLWGRYLLRERVLKKIRSFFDAQGFHEVETPTLIGHPAAESYLDVFETTLLDRHRNPTKVYLSTSPEVALKKLMVAGIGNCYSITKSFRNTEVGDVLHSPEFTILEWYRVGATYTNIVEDCEELILHILNAVSLDHNKAKPCRQGLALNTQTVSYQDNCIDLTPPWKRVSVKEAFQKYARVDFEGFFDMENARATAKSKGYTVRAANVWEELYNQIFLNEIEPHLGLDKPTILYDFPSSLAALAKKKGSDPRFAERFELYIGGLELGDCYTELTDWKEQEKRFNKEIGEIKRLGKTPYDYDHDFIDALKAGLPPCAGIAVGVDRLIMLLADTKNIADTMFFPIEELL
jgi:lysyl-tRNA synthetase class 2